MESGRSTSKNYLPRRTTFKNACFDTSPQQSPSQPNSIIYLPLGLGFALAFVVLPLPYLRLCLDVFQHFFASQKGFFSVRGGHCDYSKGIRWLLSGCRQAKALPMDGSPTGTTPSLWWMAHLMMAATGLDVLGVCSDLETAWMVSCAISYIVFNAACV